MRDSSDLEQRLRGQLDVCRTREAASLLYRAYQADVRRFVGSRVSADRVDDLCGDVWLAVASALQHFRGESRPLTWILEIARHKLADLARGRAGRPMGPIEKILDELVASSAARPSQALQRDETRNAVRRVIARLSPDEQELLELRYARGLTPAQIIKEKNLPDRPNTVSKRLSLLRRRLRQLFEEESALAQSEPGP